jgi:hypothetical protein
MTASVQASLIRSIPLVSCLLILGACGFISQKGHVVLPSIPAPVPSANEVVVSLRPTNLEREGRLQITINANGSPKFEEPGPEKLMRGDLTVGGERMSFFVPLYGPHPLTSKENHHFENTSTLISVDSNHDGKLDRTEEWWSSLPVRLGDQMFDVKAIDPGSKWILLSQSSARLAGVVVGKRCPVFQFLTTDGKIASLADYRGKALLLDVWSMT